MYFRLCLSWIPGERESVLTLLPLYENLAIFYALE